MLKKEILAIKRLGFPSIRITISIKVQGLELTRHCTARAIQMTPKGETVQAFALSLEIQQGRRKEKKIDEQQ